MCQAILLLYYVEWVGAIQVSITLKIEKKINIYNLQVFLG